MSDVGRSDAALIAAVVDAVEVVDDYVRGVLGLIDGRIGGETQSGRSWSQRLFGRSPFGSTSNVAKMMGARFGGEQLRKAADAADDVVTAVDDLRAAVGRPAQAALQSLLDLDVLDLPSQLRDPELGPASETTRAIHLRVSRMLSVLNETRTRIVLTEMRDH